MRRRFRKAIKLFAVVLLNLAIQYERAQNFARAQETMQFAVWLGTHYVPNQQDEFKIQLQRLSQDVDQRLRRCLLQLQDVEQITLRAAETDRFYTLSVHMKNEIRELVRQALPLPRQPRLAPDADKRARPDALAIVRKAYLSDFCKNLIQFQVSNANIVFNEFGHSALFQEDAQAGGGALSDPKAPAD